MCCISLIIYHIITHVILQAVLDKGLLQPKFCNNCLSHPDLSSKMDKILSFYYQSNSYTHGCVLSYLRYLYKSKNLSILPTIPVSTVSLESTCIHDNDCLTSHITGYNVCCNVQEKNDGQPSDLMCQRHKLCR